MGTGGAHEVKEHFYFCGVDWNSLLRHKAEFVPQLQHDEDTSYFDSRIDRYSHEIEDDTDDTDDSPVFGLFSSCSPQYRKVHSSSKLANPEPEQTVNSSIKITTSVVTTPDAKSENDIKTDQIFTQVTPPNNKIDNRKISLDLSLCNMSTPESSQTDSDDVSPQIYRRRKTGHGRDILPKFSISVEDEHSSIDTCTSSSENRELSPLGRVQHSPGIPQNKHKSRSVVKSASASGLSLMIPSGKVNRYMIHLTSIRGV